MSASVWDPAGSNIPVASAANTLFPQVFIATAGQQVFPITNFVYTLNTGSLLIFVNGVYQLITKDFTETSTTSFAVTTTELVAGDIVVALGFVGVTAAITGTAANVSYAATTLADILLNHSDLVVTSFTALRALQHIYYSFAYLTGAVTSGDGSSGFYWYNASDTTSADNGSSIIVAADGGRWYLLLNSGTTAAIGDNTNNGATTKFVQQSHVSDLVHLLHPSPDGKWRDMYRAGMRSAFHQQQWGGGIVGYELTDAATDVVFPFDSATGFIEDALSANAMGSLTTNIFSSQGFKTGENMSIQAMWIKLYKIANPADNVKLIICADDGTGKPSGFVGITNGVANLINGKQVGSSTNGAWYRFVFATPPVVIAGTQYHSVLTRSGAVDATNYFVWKGGSTGKYPFGQACLGTTTTWSTTATIIENFILEPVAANQMLKSGGIFGNSTLTFNQDILNLVQSKVLVDRMVNYATGKNFTHVLRVVSPAIGTTLMDMLIGLNHDRLVLTCNAGTGFLQATLYDTNKNVTTLIAVQAINLASFQDIAVVFRCYNDGSDYLQLWINGVMLAQTTAASYNMSPLWRDLGTRWIGGGFPLAPVWTQDMSFATLPSAQGWTWTGTGTEANCMSVANGKLYQNKTGYAATDTGYYTKAAAGLSNANGWIVEVNLRDLFSSNTSGTSAINIQIQDGVKSVYLLIEEYFVQTLSASVDFTVQLDIKSWDTDFIILGKGTTYYVFANGKLIIDGTNKLVLTSATNSIIFGDGDATSGVNADVIWSAFKYYTGGIVLPSISSGMILHESAYLRGNQSAYLSALYNVGTPISVKNYWNSSRNYVQEIPWTIQMLGVAVSPTTTVTSAGTKIPEMESFVLGDKFSIAGNTTLASSVVNNDNLGIILDGNIDIKLERIFLSTTASYTGEVQVQLTTITYSGMHKFELYCYGNSPGTITFNGQQRVLNISNASSSY